MRMQQVAAERTNFLRLVIQDIHHEHNVSACLRSADAFGIARVDVVTLHESFKPSTAAKGVEQWLILQRYRQIEACADDLRAQGFALAAGYPDAGSVPLHALPLDRPLAIVFGNEHDGVDDAWKEHLDYRFTIPMVGMVESLNISVSCAITLQALRFRLESSHADFKLSGEEQAQLLNHWAARQRQTPSTRSNGAKP
jgi:tRNA (guanosine-2'-O-)-methyltransferase